MEVKCKICGTINDGETNFCKGCFVKLDVENPENVTYNPKENEISAEIEEKQETIPWSDDNPIEASQNVIDNELAQMQSNQIINSNINEEVNNDAVMQPMVEENIPVIENNEPIVSNQIEIQNNDLPPIESNEMKSIEEDNFVLEPINDDNSETTQMLKQDNVPAIQQQENIELKPITDENPNVKDLDATEIIDFDSINEAYNNINNEVVSLDNNKVETLVEPININSKEEIDNKIENNIEEVDTVKPLEVEPLATLDNSQEIMEESIPEITNDNWSNDSKLPELDMDQFNDDSWEKETEEVEKPSSDIAYISGGKLFFKFLLNCLLFGVIFGAICIGFRYLLNNIFNLGNNAELVFIVISSISSIATLLIATDKTFKKQVPLATKINGTTFSILLFIALPYLLIKLVYNLYVGTTFVIFLILIALSLIILAIFFNYMRSLIRNKHQMKKDDKASFIYGLFSILLIGATLYGVYTYQDKDYSLSFNTLFNGGANVELAKSYIAEVEKAIAKNKQEIDGYEIPNVIENVEFASYDGKKPDAMALYVNENGKVSSGTIIVDGKVYSYDGEKVKAS